MVSFEIKIPERKCSGVLFVKRKQKDGGRNADMDLKWQGQIANEISLMRYEIILVDYEI